MSDVMTQEQQQLVLDNRGIARLAARRLSQNVRSDQEEDEVKGCAQLALCRAAARFDPKRGVKFASYAYWACFNAINEHIWDRGLIQTPAGLRRQRCADAERKALADEARRLVGDKVFVGMVEKSLGPAEAAERNEELALAADRLASVLAVLPPRERSVFQRRLNGELYRDIAKDLKVSVVRARQLVGQAEDRIGQHFPQAIKFFQQNRKGAA